MKIKGKDFGLKRNKDIVRIIIISTPVFRVPVSGYAGLEVIAWQTAKGLAEKGHEVSLVAPDDSECPGVTIISVGPERQVNEKMAYGGFPEMRDGETLKRKSHQGYWQELLNADCVVDHSWEKWSYQLKAEGKLRAPILGVFHAPVNTMYGTWPPTFPGLLPVEKACAVCISEDQKNHFEALHSKPARCCYNGIDTDYYKEMEGIRRTDRFLFLARFSTIKGPDLAIEACLKAGVGLDLVGDTTITGEPGLFKKCQDMADGRRIKIVGGVPRGETVWWYTQAHCFLHLNQRFREPLGLAPLEAMACGVPVIAWRYGALPETVKDRETGWLVGSFDEVVNTIDMVKGTESPETWQWVRKKCREWVCDNFTVQRMVDRYEDLCQEAVETGGW